MTWNATTPNDATYPANTIHTQIQNDKQMIRERFEASDGNIDAHYAADSTNSGKHQPSIVGFCKIHTDYAALSAYTPKVPGSMHAVQSPKSLYTIDSTGMLVKMYPVDHNALDGREDDDHTQYQTLDLLRAFSGNLTVAGLTATAEGISGSDSLPSSHASATWDGSHGLGTMGANHIGAGAIDASYGLTKTVHTGSLTVTSVGQFTIPWMEDDLSTSEKSYYLIIKHDNTIGFADYNGTYATDLTIAAGEW